MSSESVVATYTTAPDGMPFEVATGSGFAISFDSRDASERRGPSPVETVLATLATCTAMDVVSILRKKRQELRGYQIAVTGERADEHPRVYTAISVEHRVVGEVQPEALRRSIELSVTKYCPVNAMLARSVEIEHHYRLWQGAAEGEGLSARVARTGPDGTQVD